MNNNETVAILLNEAAYLLDEAAAKDNRKETIKDVKNLKDEEKVKLFLKGKLDKSEAEKIYNEVKADLNKLLEKANDIPDETTFEKMASYFRSSYTLKGCTRYVIAGLALGVVENVLSIVPVLLNSFAALVALTVASEAASVATSIAVFNSLRKTGNGNEKNWNKAYAMDIVNRYINKLEKAYKRYYK